MNDVSINVLLVMGYHETAKLNSTLAPPLGLYRLKHYLEKKGMSCDVLDLGLEASYVESGNMVDTYSNFGKYRDLIDQGRYDVVGVSVDQENMNYNLLMLWDLHSQISKLDKKCLLIAGGQAATHDYEKWLTEGALDAILFGFAENTLYELCLGLSQAPDDHISKIAANIDGIAFHDTDENIVRRPQRYLTEEEFHEYNFKGPIEMDIPYDKYWAYASTGRTDEKRNLTLTEKKSDRKEFHVEAVRLYTSSHCSWKCGFCNSQSFLNASGCGTHPVYRLTPEEIHELILYHVERYNPKVFVLSDDAFIDGSRQGERHIMGLCELIIESKKKGEIPPGVLFNCQTRINDFITEKPERVVNKPLIKALMEAGFHHFGMGVESFSDRLLHTDSLNKRATSANDANMVIAAQLEAGMSPQMNIILFIPETTVEELFQVMQATTGWILKGAQISLIPLMQPNPGSGIYEKIQKGISDIEIEWGSWENPHNGRTVNWPLYCRPRDQKLAALIDKFELRDYQDMARFSKSESDKIMRSLSWDTKNVPRPIQALSVFITVSKLLNRDDMVEFFENAVETLLQRNAQANLSKKEAAQKNLQDLQDLPAKEGLIL
ncbi:MAG: hypothetical protein ISR48_10860 [Alphaproteobacteria bacterium]|nr:hypothetical protein [Alphaproteobacteria bacterium]